MKHLFVLILCMGMVACTTTKTERQARSTIDGTWLLNSVTYDRSGTFEIELFDDASAKCFESSKWFFRSNNSTGYYDIVDTTCPTGQRNIRWAAVETAKDSGEYNFTMKLVDEKNRDIQEDTGYKMNLKYLDNNTMTLTLTINFEGSPFDINLNFSRLTQ